LKKGGKEKCREEGREGGRDVGWSERENGRAKGQEGLGHAALLP